MEGSEEGRMDGRMRMKEREGARKRERQTTLMRKCENKMLAEKVREGMAGTTVSH